MSISANNVSFDAYNMCVELSDGRTVTVPLAWFPRLLKATQAQRQVFRIGRRGIHWPELDEDISIAGILEGRGDVTRHRREAAYD
ncbi:DUF2442 domain-containing protein [Microvirga massiliensis]|uniref:DUF2442 domain-containing protein n=1 Tax=Microvirga massiliensis TaxID=1033741 RepID=UPI00062BED31|nr:DUF2442 domain-containing protein [Microvirga massiliensis]